MPKKQKKTKVSRSSLVLPMLALALIALGLIGLTVVNTKRNLDRPEEGQASHLKVKDASGRAVEQSQTTGPNLQNAARTQDLMKDKPANSVQKGGSIPQGTNIDELLENKEIN